MKRFSLTSVALLGVALLACLPSRQASAQTSFNLTNVLAGSGFGQPPVLITGWPTNQVSATTGLPQGTGGPINVKNYDWATFYFSALICTNVGGGTPTTNNVQVSLIRSVAGNPPAVAYGSNPLGLGTGTGTGAITNLQASDWETYSNITPPLTLTIPISGTGAVTWLTNLNEYFIGPVSWVGVRSIQLDATNAFLTNVVCGLNTKIVPIRYP
jgi:hypothetical protein